jgi:Phage tail tube protein
MSGTADFANPSRTQARFSFEGTPGLGDPVEWTDFRLLSEGVGAELPLITDESLNPAGEQEQGDPGKINLGGPLNVNFHAEDHAKLLAAFFGLGATAVESPTGVFTHRFSALEEDIVFPCGVLEIAPAERSPYVYTGVVPNALNFSAAPNNYLSGSVGLAIPRMHPFADQAIVAGTPPDVAYLRGLPRFDTAEDATDTERRIYIQVQSKTASTVTIKCKIGAAASYSGADIVCTEGEWTRLTDEADAEVGSFDLPVEIMFTEANNYTANDAIYFQTERPIWTPALNARSVFNEIFMEILIDGEVERVNAFTAALTRPVERDENIGGRFVDATYEQGVRTAVFTINRRAFKTETMLHRLLRAESLALRVNALSTLIGSTVVRRQLSLIAPNCLLEGRTPSVGGASEFPELVTLRAFPSDDVSYPSAVTAELVLGTEDLIGGGT